MQNLAGKYKYIIFDFDGTINNTAPGIHATFKAVLDKFGISYDGVDFDNHIGPPLDFSYSHLMGDKYTFEAIEAHRQIYADTNAAANSFLYEGIEDTLIDLTNKGYVLAVASSKYEPHAIESLKLLGLYKYFVYVYGQTDRRGYKNEVLCQLVEDHGWDRKQCLMIGDTTYDMQGAIANNIDFLAVTYGFGKEQDLVVGNPVAVAHCPKEISQLL